MDDNLVKVLQERHENLLKVMKSQQLDALLISREDQFLGEEVREQEERLKWLTNFSGSAGICAISEKKSAIFVDGRYGVQVTQQSPASIYHYRKLDNEDIVAWLNENIVKNSKIGFDARQFSSTKILALKKLLKKYSFNLIPLQENFVDKVWTERNVDENEKVFSLAEEYSGMSMEAKISLIQTKLQENESKATIVSDPASTSWLLNLRSDALTHTPFLLAYSIVMANGEVYLFYNKDKLSATIQKELEDNNVIIYSPDSFYNVLSYLVKSKDNIHINNINCPYMIYETLMKKNAKIQIYPDPIAIAKSHKNEKEQQGFIDAHIQDGIAMIKFCQWLSGLDLNNNVVTEYEVSQKIDNFRRSNPQCLGLSFGTIAGYGANAALPHYRATKEDCAQLQEGSVLLLDSGGQYLNGTTDITRTFALGIVNQEIKHMATLVLKGHIRLSSARFPEETNGIQLDILARSALWQEGYNYSHGTGHGIGHFLSVHETPSSISYRYNGINNFYKGCVVTNEPGYYRAGEFGIRIENTLLTVDYKDNFLQFKNLTLCPFDKNLIDVSLLNAEEKKYLNLYHKEIFDTLKLHLKDEQLMLWLQNATSPL